MDNHWPVSPVIELALDTAEADPILTKPKAKALAKTLRADLLKAQYARLKRADQALLVVIAGLDGVGKGGCINLLNEWMDARYVHTLAFGPPGPQVAAMPYYWRYWRYMPAKGATGVVFGSWYRPLLDALAAEKPDENLIETRVREIREFEAALACNGVQVLKLWFHMSRDAQHKRVKKLSADPDLSWQIDPVDHLVYKQFARLRKAGARAMTQTHTASTPWIVVPAADDKQRIVHTAQAVLVALRRRAPTRLPVGVHKPEPAPTGPSLPALSVLDHDAARLKKSVYERELLPLQARLARLVRHPRLAQRRIVWLFEGPDAAGKGGTIRRITHALDARQYRAIPISAPSDEEQARPYLWRFWRRLPEHGKIAIFDRSWYGRVLVERVEGFTPEWQWRRAYQEINQFERQLVDEGTILLKFWLDITPNEQLERFRDRQKSIFKSFKITPEDWRNRAHWDEYTLAAQDMFDQTHTAFSPWQLIAANDKHYARIAVITRLVETLEQAIQE